MCCSGVQTFKEIRACPPNASKKSKDILMQGRALRWKGESRERQTRRIVPLQTKKGLEEDEKSYHTSFCSEVKPLTGSVLRWPTRRDVCPTRTFFHASQEQRASFVLFIYHFSAMILHCCLSISHLGCAVIDPFCLCHFLTDMADFTAITQNSSDHSINCGVVKSRGLCAGVLVVWFSIVKAKQGRKITPHSSLK